MLDGLAYGLYAAFVWGLTDICAALASRRDRRPRNGRGRPGGEPRRALPLRDRHAGRPAALAVLGGLLDVSGYIVYATGLQKSLVWLVGLSSSFGPAVAILIAVVFLGERLRPVQWLGLGALATGIVLVGLP